MKKAVLTLVITMSSVSAIANAAKLNVTCSDAPRGKDSYYVDVVHYSKEKLILESWNASYNRYEVKAVLPYKKCTIHGITRSLQQQ